MARRLGPLVLLVVLATACSTWTMAGQGATRRGWNRDDTTVTPANVATMAASWAATLTGNGDEPIGTPSIVVSHTASQIRGLTPGTGAVLWTASLASGVGALRDPKLFIAAGGADCTLRATKSADGTAAGTAHFGGPIFTPAGLSACTTSESILSDDVRVVVPWQTTTVGSGGPCGGTVTRWAYTAGVSAYSTDLVPLWTASTAETGCGALPNIAAKPRYGAVTRTTNHFVATFGNNVVAFPTTCTLGTACLASWTKPIANPRGQVDSVSKNTLAVVDGAGTVTAIDETTGATQWTASIGASATLPLASTNASIFAISGNTLYALRAGGCGAGVVNCTGTQRWKSTLAFTPAARASVSGDTLFVGGGTTVAALDATGTANCSAGVCTPLATRTVASAVTGPVVSLNNRVYVPTVNALRTFTVASS